MIPTNFLDGLSHLNGVGLLWQLLLGEQHPFIAAYREMLDRLNRKVVRYAHDFDNADQRLNLMLRPPTILFFLRHVQVASVRYWDEALSQGELPCREPNFVEQLDAMELCKTSWMPNLPTQYFGPIKKPGDSNNSTICGLITRTEGTSVPALAGGGGSTSGVTSSQSGSSQQNSVPNSSINIIFEPFIQRV